MRVQPPRPYFIEMPSDQVLLRTTVLVPTLWMVPLPTMSFPSTMFPTHEDAEMSTA